MYAMETMYSLLLVLKVSAPGRKMEKLLPKEQLVRIHGETCVMEMACSLLSVEKAVPGLNMKKTFTGGTISLRDWISV